MNDLSKKPIKSEFIKSNNNKISASLYEYDDHILFNEYLIGYGYQSYGQKQSEQSESEARAEYEFNLIKDWTKQSKCKGRLVIKYFPNHSKLLIVDDKYAVCGSFNWLSNSGRTVNSEESWVIRNQNFVNERKNVIVNSFLDN